MPTVARLESQRRHIGLVSQDSDGLAGNSSPLADESLEVTFLGPPTMPFVVDEIAAKFCLLLLIRPGLAATHAFCRRIRSKVPAMRVLIEVPRRSCRPGW